MKKVTAFVGTARKKHTYSAVRQFLDNLQVLGDVECEIVALSDYRIGMCRACKQCIEKGEEFCPLKDDRDMLFGKMMASDGVVFASPNYAFQNTGIMKIFLDRLGFVFHRPRFFGKTFTSIVVQGNDSGDKIVKYLDSVGVGLGFNTVKSSRITVLETMTEKEEQKIDKILAGQSWRFREQLVKPAYPAPTMFKLWGFRYARTSIGLLLDDSNRDYQYFKDKGWLGSDYYYPVRLGALKKAEGRLFDSIARSTTGKKIVAAHG
jgi:multimeric flavodoxin WrbA